MYKITLKIDGMMCGMCEAHINDAIRREFSVRKVTSSHSRGETVIIADNSIDESLLHSAISDTGYTMTDYTCEPYEKKGLLAKLFGK